MPALRQQQMEGRTLKSSPGDCRTSDLISDLVFVRSVANAMAYRQYLIWSVAAPFRCDLSKMRPSRVVPSPKQGIAVLSRDLHSAALNEKSMFKRIVLTALAFASIRLIATAELVHKTENVVLITIDGFALAGGFYGHGGTVGDARLRVWDTNRLRGWFWRETSDDRRQALLPFFE